jgi:hypothetical protein
MQAVELVVGHPVGRDQAAELAEQFARERLIATDALCVGDKAEQLLGVTCGECRHRTFQKIRRMPNGLHSRPE